MIKRKKIIKWQCGRGEYDEDDDDNDPEEEDDTTIVLKVTDTILQ